MASDFDMWGRSGDRSAAVCPSNRGDEAARVGPRSTAAWSRVLWPSLAWLVPLAFVALPNCSFPGNYPPDFKKGEEPLSSIIFCDIEDMDVPRHCASDGELMTGIPLEKAAVNLIRGVGGTVALDYSPAAIAAAGCPAGHPVAITFKDNFPTGYPRCLNCGEVIPDLHADVQAACIALCKDITKEHGDSAPSTEVIAFCDTHARPSTNAGSCFEGVCTTQGKEPMLPAADPRRTPEPVVWQDVSQGVSVTGNTLTRTDAGSEFDQGAAGAQTITRGDAYVEFVASPTDRACILGLSPGPLPDSDPSNLDIAFGIRLIALGGAAGQIQISEYGGLQHDPDNPDPNDYSWGEFQTGDRFRISVEDQLDGTATVTYWHLLPGCDGTSCLGVPLRTAGQPAPYPFRVDASLGAQGATLTDVRIVRIK